MAYPLIRISIASGGTLPPASAESSTAAPEYTPRFRGDPAHSNAEAGALGYLRTVLMAQKLYKRKHEAFATSLPGLVHTGSFTQRMTKTDRGDYSVSFHAEPKGTGFSLSPRGFAFTKRDRLKSLCEY